MVSASQNTLKYALQGKGMCFYACLTLMGIVVVLFPGWLEAQKAPLSSRAVHRISTEQGPVNLKSTSLFCDKKGFVWFGTFDGMHRYDGYSLKTYRQLPGEAHNIKGGLVYTINEDPAGFMWVGTELGLNRFDPAMDTFGTIPIFNDATADVEEGGIQDIHISEDGVPWVMVSVFGMGWVDAARNRVQHFVLDSTPLVLAPYAYHSKFGKSNRKNAVWVSELRNQKWTLYLVDTKEKTKTAYPIKDILPSRIIFSIAEDLSGQVWLATQQGLYVFDPNSGICREATTMPGMPQSLKNTSIYALCITRENVLWIGTLQKGLIQYDLSTASGMQYLSNPDDANSLWDNTVLNIEEDRPGDIWVANAAGYCRLDRKDVHYNKITAPFQNTINHSVNQFCEGQDGVIYASSAYAGIFEIDRSRNRVRNMSNRVTGLPAIIPVNKLHIDDQNMLWAGTNGKSLYKINLRNNTFEHNAYNIHDAENLVFTYINGLESTPDQLLWLGTLGGLYTYDKSTTQKQKIPLSQGEDTNESESRNITTIYHDRKGLLWVGTYNGLFIGDPKTRTFERLPITQMDRQSGFKYTIYTVFQDHWGVVWLGTNDGLIKVIPSDLPVAQWACYPITEKQGLPNNLVLGIAEDKYHRLWIGSGDGVVLLKNPHDVETKLPIFKQLPSTLKDREQGERTKPVFRGSDGTMYIGGADGLYFIHEDSIPENTHVPPIVITSFKKFNTDKPDEPAKPIPGITALKEVRLTYKNNIFTIEFAALDYHAPAQNKFAYRIKGFNDNWIQLGTQHQVTFTNLDPGTYYFTVKGCNNDGVWNEEGVTLKIIITPPWWQTTWAYLAYALIFVSAVFAFIRARTRFLENRAKELQEAVTHGTAQIVAQKEKIEQQTVELQALERLKWRFYTNITHELRTPLTLMLGPVSTLLKGKTPDAPDFHLLKIAQQNGRKLYRRVSEMLDFSKLETEHLELAEKPVHIASLTSRLVGNFESHAQFLGIHLTHTIEPPPDRVILLDVDKYETIVDNLLSNALKFTSRGGWVKVALAIPAPNRLLLTVRDNGPGIHPEDLPHVFNRYYQTKFSNAGAEGGTGIGLALCAELAQLFRGTIQVESAQGSGTAFFIEWPVTDVVDPEQPEIESAPESPEAVVLPQSSQPSTLSAGVPRILVVEDNPDLQAFLIHLLSDVYLVQTAQNGEDAIAWLNERPDHRVDLILSDIMMPKMDGFALLEYLKAHERYRHIPVVLLTARADMSDRLRALRIGVHDYLTKPFEEEELMVRIENLLQRSQIREVALAEEPELEPAEMSAADAVWLEELDIWTRKNLNNDLLNVGALARQMNLSERQLLRRLRELAGMTPQQYIQEMRLLTARDLLERGVYRTVAEVAYATGFGHPKVFSRAFRARFGRLPSVYF